MNIGIITYVAKDNSHGYLLKLDNLEEKYVHDILNQNDTSESCYIKLQRKDFILKKFQNVKLFRNSWLF